MGKTLIRPATLDPYIADGRFYLDNTMILSCGAKDALRQRGIAIVYGPRPGAAPKPEIAPQALPPETEALIARVLEILKQDHGIEDMDQCQALALKIITELNKC